LLYFVQIWVFNRIMHTNDKKLSVSLCVFRAASTKIGLRRAFESDARSSEPASNRNVSAQKAITIFVEFNTNSVTDTGDKEQTYRYGTKI
jgi:hypothetical protein